MYATCEILIKNKYRIYLLLLYQAFAQNSTMAIHNAIPQAHTAIQALNHKDVNGTLEHLILASKLLGPTLRQAPTNTKAGQARCIAPTVEIQTLSREVPNPSNPSSGTVSMSAIKAFNRVVPSPSNPNNCIVSTLAIQTLSKMAPTLSNPNSGAVSNSAIQMVNKIR